MSSPVPPYHRFLRRVHRRLVAVRVAEAAGVGLLAGSGLAIVLAVLLLWLGRPAVEAVAGVMTAGALCGAAVGAARLPGVMQSAVTADVQLGLADLMSTALAVEEGSTGESWGNVVVSAANARSARLSPSEVLLRRFNGRVWGGIAVTASLAVTLAAFSAGSANVLAGGGDLATGAQIGFSATLPPLPGAEVLPPHSRSSPARRRTWADPDDQGRSIGGVTESPDVRPPDSTAAATGSEQHRGSADDIGPGSASSGASAKSHAPVAPPTASPSPGMQTAADATGAGGGGATSSGRAHAGDRSSLFTGSTATPAQAAPPWKASSWPSDVTAARQAVDAGRVPAGFRDLVRDYFDKP